MSKSKHDKAVDRIAKKRGGQHRREGIDLVTPDSMGIEVAIEDSDIYQSIDQLKRSRTSRKYIAVPASKENKVRDILERTGIGIMDLQGNIKKKARKK